jgi:hypothetical protein
LDDWPVWHSLATVVILVATFALWQLGFNRQALSALPVACVGLLAFAVCGPNWSLFSPPLSDAGLRARSIGIGAVCAYSLVVGASLPRRFCWLFGAILIAYGVSADHELGIYAGCAALASDPILTLRFAWLLLVPVLARGIVNGVVWEPGPSIEFYSHRSSIKAARILQFVVSNFAIGFAFLGLFVATFSDRFILRQFRTLLRQEPRRICLIKGFLFLAVLGLGWPHLLVASAVVLAFALCWLLYDALTLL